MTLIKIIVIIVAVWIILKIKVFISGIKIASGKSLGQKKDNIRKTGMNIQDADYEDIE